MNTEIDPKQQQGEGDRPNEPDQNTDTAPPNDVTTDTEINTEIDPEPVQGSEPQESRYRKKEPLEPDIIHFRSDGAPSAQHPFQSPKQNSKSQKYEYSQKELQSLRQAIHNSGVVRLAFYFLDYILRAQTALFEQIYSQKDLSRIIGSMSVLCILLASIYGLVMGMYNGALQSFSSAIKLPILFLLTALICIPSLYTFNVLLGQSFKFLQTVALMVMTLGTTTILLASLAPIAFFFTLTTPDNYQFLMLMHVLIFGLCGIYGVRYLYRGSSYIAFRMDQPLNNMLLRIWIVIYAVVGMQLGWRLRPFIGNKGMSFELLRSEVGGNFYIAVWNSFLELFSGGS